MPILNQNLEFKNLPIDIQQAFRDCAARKELIPAGKTLYRFAGHAGISPWWGDTNQLVSILISAKQSKKSLAEYIRHTSAVLRQWSPDMMHLIVGQLYEPVYAFTGIIAIQDEADKYQDEDSKDYKKKFTKSVFMQGGHKQLYLGPDKDNIPVNIIVPPGAVNVYDPVDDIIDFLQSYKLV